MIHNTAVALTVLFTVLFTVSLARADPPKVSKTAPRKLQGTYKRTLSEAAHDMTADKGSSCGDEARAQIRRMAESVMRVTVSANSVTVNNGKPNPIVFASEKVVISNTVIDRDDRFTTALRLMVLDGALTITYNKVERETADWCSDTFGVMIQRD